MSKEPRRIYRLPKLVYDNYLDGYEMHRLLWRYLSEQQKNNSSSYNLEVPYFTNDKFGIEKKFSREIKLYDEIFQSLAAKEMYSTKWKNELSLFQMLKRIYPDAIYQHHSDWLELQSLDVYVPSKKLAFEYQGIQHYQAVGFFGGIEGFEKRKRLDQKKKDLCTANGIELIEWKYDEPVSKILLKDKLAKKGLTL